jgi:hypothetical protein
VLDAGEADQVVDGGGERRRGGGEVGEHRVAARRPEDEHALPGEVAGEEDQEGDRGPVGPLEVLEDQEQRVAGGEGLQEGQEVLEPVVDRVRGARLRTSWPEPRINRGGRRLGNGRRG